MSDFSPVDRPWIPALLDNPILFISLAVVVTVLLHGLSKLRPMLTRVVMVALLAGALFLAALPFVAVYDSMETFAPSNGNGFLVAAYSVAALFVAVVVTVYMVMPSFFIEDSWHAHKVKLFEAKVKADAEAQALRKTSRRDLGSKTKNRRAESEDSAPSPPDRLWPVKAADWAIGILLRPYLRFTGASTRNLWIGRSASALAFGVVVALVTFAGNYLHERRDSDIQTLSETLGISYLIPVVDTEKSVPALQEWAKCRYGVGLSNSQAETLLEPLSAPMDSFWVLSYIAEWQTRDVAVNVSGSTFPVRLHHNGGREYAFVSNSGPVPERGIPSPHCP